MIEDQFDVAAQDRRAEAARKSRAVPPYAYDRDAVIAAAAELEALAAQIEAEGLAAEAAAKAEAEAEVVEVPEGPKVEQEPELPGTKADE